MAKAAKEASVADRALSRIIQALDAYLADPVDTASKLPLIRSTIPDQFAKCLDDVLGDKRISYRDGLLIQASFGLEDVSREKRHTIRPEGGRGVASRIGSAFAARHIASVRDAYQNIGKNTDVLARGNVPAFDAALSWFDTAANDQREAALSYCLATISLTARNVLPCPDIDSASLTFLKLSILLDELLRVPSGGAYQQYASAAFLHSVIEEAGQGGPGGLRVETKRLNATDASSKVAGDIQVLRGNRVEEAFEVTANDWKSKIDSAVACLKAADLARIHILASVDPAFSSDSAALSMAGADVTVIDVGAFLRVLGATMRKPARAAALVRLYEFLDRYQSDIERVNTYVRLLAEHKLTR